MSKKILTTPISAEDLADIKIGDVIYLTGHIVTCRDVPHRHQGRRDPARGADHQKNGRRRQRKL